MSMTPDSLTWVICVNIRSSVVDVLRVCLVGSLMCCSRLKWVVVCFSSFVAGLFGDP